MKNIIKECLIVALLITNCSENKNNTEIVSNSDENYIFKHFLYQALDSITRDIELKDKILVHYDIYPDSIKHIIIRGHIKRADTSNKKNIKLLSLLQKLKGVLDDSVKLNVDEREFKKCSFYHKEESIEKYVDFESNDFLGSINLSRVVFDKEEESACFYIAVQCGRKCGGGYIVLLEKERDTDWKIVELKQMWH